jgi:site-specific DNA-methyltransferase (adenine-specific)
MVCAIEDAGFEIRDSIMWIYGQGFPKSLNIGKEVDKLQGNERELIKKMPAGTGPLKTGHAQKGGGGGFICDERSPELQVTKGNSEFEGWGTALKPAHEPICVARKPIEEKTVAQNVLKYGTGGINIDGCRIETENILSRGLVKGVGTMTDELVKQGARPDTSKWNEKMYDSTDNDLKGGRFPANIILDPFTADLLDEQEPDAGAFAKVKSGHNGKSSGIYGDYASRGDDGDTFYDDKGGASRFFYIAKAYSGERNEGLYQFDKVRESDRVKTDGTGGANPRNRSNTNKNNFHPTVKPIKLIQYLQRLVTPKGGTTYDPFGGSGTSGCSAINEGLNYILSEMITEYCDIANKRLYDKAGLFLK